MEKITSFLGTGWSFPPQFSKATREVKMLSDEEDIQNSLEVLLSTKVGERIMQPSYGCNMDALLFEPINLTLQTFIKDLVSTAILYYEPRIKPENVSLKTSDTEGVILIEIDYIIRTTNTRHNLVYPFYVDEGTLVNK